MSLLAVLPTELLYRVMEHVASSNRLEDATLTSWNPLPVLLSCCTLLRNAAATCPYLWATIHFAWPWSPHTRLWTHSLDAVAQHLSRSGSLELDICIQIGGYTVDPQGDSPVALLKSLLAPQMYRCCTLHVDERPLYPPETDPSPGDLVQCSFFPLDQAMPALQDTALSSSSQVNQSGFLGPRFEAQFLRYITTEYSGDRGGAPILLPILRAAYVEYVDICFINLVGSNSFEFASVFQRLRFLRIRCEEQPTMGLRHSVPLDFPCLEVLDINTDMWEPPDFLPVINAPNLQHIHCGGSQSFALQMLLREACFPRLRTLQFSGWPALNTDLSRIIQLYPTLHELEFPVTHYSEEAAIQLFQAMAPTSAEDEPVLPELRKFAVSTSMRQVQRLVPILASMLDLMQTRKTLRGEWISDRNSMQEQCASLPESVAARWQWTDLNEWESHTTRFFKPQKL